MDTLLLSLILLAEVGQLACSMYRARGAKPAQAPLPTAEINAPDRGIWGLLEAKHGIYVHHSWVREGTPAWDRGKKKGWALRYYNGEITRGGE
jgi:hypothetical protein